MDEMWFGTNSEWSWRSMDKITVVDMDKSAFIRRLRGDRKMFRISWAPPVSMKLMGLGKITAWKDVIPKL